MSFRGGLYPEILHIIVGASDYKTRLSLRAVSHNLREEVDGVLATRLILRNGAMYSKEESGDEAVHPLSVLNSDLARALDPFGATHGVPLHSPHKYCRGPNREASNEECRQILQQTLSRCQSLEHANRIYVAYGIYNMRDKISIVRISTVEEHWDWGSPAKSGDRIKVDTAVVCRYTKGVKHHSPVRPCDFVAGLAYNGQQPRRVVFRLDPHVIDAGPHLMLGHGPESTEPDNSELVLVALLSRHIGGLITNPLRLA